MFSYVKFLKNHRTGVKINSVEMGVDVIYQTDARTMDIGWLILEDPVVGVQSIEQSSLYGSSIEVGIHASF